MLNIYNFKKFLTNKNNEPWILLTPSLIVLVPLPIFLFEYICDIFKTSLWKVFVKYPSQKGTILGKSIKVYLICLYLFNIISAKAPYPPPNSTIELILENLKLLFNITNLEHACKKE